MSLIHNEKTKLLAGALNTAATSSFTIGVLAPLAAAFYDLANRPVAASTLLLGTAVWFSSAVALHLAARLVLGKLIE